MSKKVCDSCKVELSKKGTMSPNCEFCEEEKLTLTIFSFDVECNSLGKSAIRKELTRFLKDISQLNIALFSSKIFHN